MAKQIVPDGQCTKEQTQALHICTQQFTSSSVISKNFSPALETPSLLVTKEQLDKLEPFCAAYKV